MIFTYKKITIFFGNRNHAIEKKSVIPFFMQPAWQKITDAVNADLLFGVNQSHSNQGIKIVAGSTVAQGADAQVDFLYTKQKKYALAVMTADCVPLFLYDEKNEAVVAVHAGWKGLTAGIIKRAIAVLIDEYDNSLHALKVFIGPAARSCCYEIRYDTYKQMSDAVGPLAPDCPFFIQKSKDTWHVDLITYTKHMLCMEHILPENIHTEHAVCTICSPLFCSYRREKNEERNVHVIVLQQ